MRIPNNYDVRIDEEPVAVTVMESEFANYVSGQRDDVPEDVKKKLRSAMKKAGAKTAIFLLAYAQKNMGRLARIMGALDNVDRELLQDWRYKTMDSEMLIDLMAELSVEKHRTAQEVIAVSSRFGKAGEDYGAEIFGDEEEKIQPELRRMSRGSRRKVVDFFNRRVVAKV